MAKDDSNDPFAPRDATVLRPRPGVGRRPGAPQAGARLEATPTTGGSPRGSAPVAPLTDYIGAGLSPLLQAAVPLLAFAGRLRSTTTPPEVAGLRRQVLDEIRKFEDRARLHGVAPETVTAARYALCATLDEAVLSTPWGAQGEWASQTLLVTLHREAWGGEKFFEMLNRIASDPARHIDLMELQYVCLALGFAGKYQVQDRGHSQLAEIQADLARRIAAYRGKVPDALSIRWQGVHDRRNPVLRYVPWWVLAVAAVAAIMGTFIFDYRRLGGLAVPVQAQLAAIGLEAPAAAAITPSGAGTRLRQLLSGEESRGVLSIEEHGAQTVVTLIASDLFASGSARVNPAYYESLRNIANAMNEVPGRVFIVGHTDDQPLRSLRFKDNFELSRERAVGVAKILELAIDNAGRLQWSGVGSSQPRFKPESLPENRARNRRVEITHVTEP
jgi:type VI secretion system protein ImpK